MDVGDGPGAAARAGRSHPGERTGTGRSAAGWWLAAFCITLFTLTSPGFDTSEGGLNFRQAEILLTDCRLDVGGEQPNVCYFPGPDGKLYSAREMGATIVQLPAAALGLILRAELEPRIGSGLFHRGRGCLMALQAGVFMALAVRYFFLILVEGFGTGGRQAWIAAMLLATSTFCWTYSHSLFDGVLALPFLMGTLYHLIRYGRTGRPGAVAIAAALAGSAVVTRVSLVFGVVSFFCFLAAAQWRSPRRLAGAAGVAAIVLAPFAVWMLWYNDLRTGSPFVSPMQLYEKQNGLDGNLVEGLAGLTVSPGKGLFVYCPLLLISALCFPGFARRHPPSAVYVAVLGVIWLLVHARLRAWSGMWGWGPRHFITVVPALMLSFGVGFTRLAGVRAVRYAIAGLAAWGLLLAAASTVVCPHYRMALALQEDRLDDRAFFWVPATAQSTDAVRAAAHNVLVGTGAAEPCHVEGASDLNNYASNTVNVWVNTLIRAGCPRGPVLAVFAGLVVIGVATGFRSYRAAAAIPGAAGRRTP